MIDIAPLSETNDWFYRVEYQQRGSSHIHMLIWSKDAPVFGVNKDDEILSFINEIISCQKPCDYALLLHLVNT